MFPRFAMPQHPARAAAALAFALAAAPALAQSGAASAAPSKGVTETHFGTVVEDPYRNLENKDDPAVAAWMKAASDRAHARLKSLPGRDAMLAAITKYDAAVSERVGQVVRLPGDRWFMQRRAASANQFKLYVRDGLNGSDRLLVDPEALEKSTGKPHAINYFAPSSDGARLGYGLSQQGSEEAVLHLMNARTGAPIGKPISRANFGAVDFAPDNRSFVFNRLQEMKAGAAPTDKYQNSQVWLLRAGEPEANAKVVFGTAIPGLGIGPAELPFVSLSDDGRWAFGFVVNGTQREFALFVSPQRAVLAGRPAWRRIVAASDDVTGMTYARDHVYLVSHKGAPRSQVLALDLARGDIAAATVIVPVSERVVGGVAAAADALYIEARDGNIKRLYRRAYAAGAETREVRLPIEGSFQLADDESGASAANPRLPGVVINLQGWTRAPQVYVVNADGSVANTGLQPKGAFDEPADVVATEVKVRAADGAMVPMSIIHKRGIALDGNHPTLLYGYASYGVTEEPFFSVSRLAWLDAGGVYAVANPRGSSVYGHDWYRAGYQETKPNTWNDFIACAEYLIAEKYTRPAKLGILGGSAGGILVGRAMTERPDLFAAVIPAVGALDMLRAESTPNGIPNIPEFGSVKTEAGFRSLLAMSTYAHIKAAPYPAVLLTHGVNDPRVEVWMTTKAAARLMASSTSGRPVLLRLDYDAGHGVGSTKKQVLEERADMFSFLLWQMGAPGYQP